LKDGDQLDVTTNTPVATVSETIVAHTASIHTPAAATFALPDGATLQIRIGPATEPVQTVVFSAADAVTPITAGAATRSQVASVLQRYVSGAKVTVNALLQVEIETIVHGTAARIRSHLRHGRRPARSAARRDQPAGWRRLPGVAHVTIADLVPLLPSADFAVDAAPQATCASRRPPPADRHHQARRSSGGDRTAATTRVQPSRR
jgi:hypothetical protein